VTRYLLRHVPAQSRFSTQVSTLRSFLRFFCQAGDPDRDLAAWVKMNGAADKTFTVDLRITEIQFTTESEDLSIIMETTSPPRNIVNEL